MRVCAAAAEKGMSVYFYGSHQDVLDRLIRNHRERFPELKIAGVEPSKFGRTTPKEKAEIGWRIRESRRKDHVRRTGLPAAGGLRQ